MAKGTSRPSGPNQQARLTHFLCLPLVNAASIQQLETSLAAFKATHQSVLGSSSKSHNQSNSSCLDIPEKAFRPLGTLHLTLGVMSLSKEQLARAASFLQSLDLAGLMHEAERVAIQSRHKDGRKQASRSTSQVSTPDMPFTVSLESLHALPQVDAAKTLYASPVDPTGRLYPFCVMLRDKFIEAGFVKAEANKQEKNHPPQGSNLQPSQASRPTSTSGDASSHQPVLPKNLDPYTVAITRMPKPRPLLLHATLVNTVYARERSADPRKTTRDRNPTKRITIDASKLFSKPPLAASALASSPPVPNNSYIWATEFPLDAICICEMGAKRLDPGAKDAHPLSERLGEQYQVVAQRNLPSTPPSNRPSRHQKQ